MRQALAKDIGGTIYFDVPIPGVISAATGAVFKDTDAKDSPTVAAASATQAGQRLSLAVASGTVDRLSETRPWRVQWAVTINSVAYKFSTFFDVVGQVVYPSLDVHRLVTRYCPMLRGRDFPDDLTAFESLLQTAWDEVGDWFVAHGLTVHMLIDPDPVEPAHAYLTAALIAENYDPGETTTWVERADRWRQMARESLERAAARLTVDRDEDIRPDEPENVGLVWTTR